VGAIVFSFCGFSIAWMEWGTVVETALWLPLIFLIKEILIKKFTLKWMFILILVESTVLFAGHLQTLFYIYLFSDIYLLSRIGQEVYRQHKFHNFISEYIGKFAPFLVILFVVAFITSIQWLPTLQFILNSARDVDQANWQTAGWFIPWQNLIQFVVPDFFGNPTTLNYWGVWNYAEFIGYIGIVPLFLAIICLFYRKDTKTLFFGALFVLSLIFALPTFFAQIPFILHIPFLSSSQPTRLLFITDFCLAILAGLGLDTFLKNKKSAIIPVLILGLIFGGLWSFILLKNHFGLMISVDNILTTKRNLVFSSILFAGVACLFLLIFISAFLKRNKKLDIIFIILFISITIFDLFRFGWKFLPFTPSQYLYPATKTTEFLQKNIGNYRYMTTDSQIFPPNFSIMYKLQSVDGYDPLYLRSYGEYIAASERGKPDIQPPFGFNRIITPHKYDSPLINLLGVKYVLSLTDISSPKLKKVFQEGETRIYENKAVLPRTFFVNNLVISNSKQETINKLFNSSLDFKNTAVVSVPLSLSKLTKGRVTILYYSPNKITLSTNNGGIGFLILTDINYPTWHAKIDGVETKIFTTDFMFRGVVIPSGKHTVIFSDSLF
jgi:hypothetical protein